MATGTVSTVKIDKGFGFIQQPHGEPDVFFHMRDLAEGVDFDDRLIEQRVQFEIIDSEKGPRAKNVRAVR